MKTTQVCFWNKWMRNGRNPGKPPFRFTEVKRLELKDRVTIGAKKHAELSCNQEMLSLMECFKLNDFDQSVCSQKVQSFRDCYNKATTEWSMKKRIKSKDELTPGQETFTTAQLNKLLKANKQP